MIGISVGVIIVLLIVITMYNILISTKNQVYNAKSSIDVYLKKRFDLIPNLIEIVKGYKEYEKEIFIELTKLRTLFTEGKDVAEDIKLNAKYNDIIMLAEAYPNIKSSEAFIKLQEQLESLEDELQAARRYYNSSVTQYNTKLVTIPFNIIAMIFGLKEEELYKIDEEEKENIKIKI